MDRLDAMKVFVAALDEGSLAGAARRLRRSPAAVSRAIAFLENHVGTELLHRTSRTIRLSATLGSLMSPGTVRMPGSADGRIDRELATTRYPASR